MLLEVGNSNVKFQSPISSVLHITVFYVKHAHHGIEDHVLIIGICVPRLKDNVPIMGMGRPIESTKMTCCVQLLMPFHT